MTGSAIGIDFGTTNSSIARCVDHSSTVELVRFPLFDETTESYRSLLYLENIRQEGKNRIASWTGPAGIEHYLSRETAGRLIQSLKSFLTSRSLQATEVFGRRVAIEDLIARILRDLREKAERQFGVPITSAVAGRPVRFVGAETEEDNAYAESRLRRAYHIAGFEAIQFEMEPVAAAHYYESTLQRDELILIGDFGGGTSDFSLIHVGPTIRHRGRTPADLVGNAGVAIAGDAFDAKIVRNLVSPYLGAGSYMRSMNKILPVPGWVYAKLERWHHLSFLKAKDTLNMLASVKAQALEPLKIEALIHLVTEDLGYHLHQAVQKTKCELSANETARFRLADGFLEVDAVAERACFERWIADEVAAIEACVDSLLQSSGVRRKDVNMVFLTGGSSFVPAVRRIFEQRFGADRIRTGNEFTSVAAGLALKAREADAQSK
ncbi:MAG TPA: Hsp70 family protein [Bryobacteraceae bacterium]|nr:Hsp70 family protein [Bryobacteraceae bacterium]